MAQESCGSDMLRQYVEKIIESGQLGKSELYPKLLRYLVDASCNGDAPKEMDIALDVFGKDESFNVHEDSIVRVYVHSLRAKLDEYYRHLGDKDEIRIEIPKGAYRVIAAPQTAAQVGPPQPPVSESSAPRTKSTRYWVIGLVTTILAVSALGNIYLISKEKSYQAQPVNEVGRTFVWRDLLQDRRPVTIVLGDLFFYTEFDKELGRQRYIGDVPINSREALRTFLKDHPDRASLLGPIDTTLLTKGTAYGLAAIMPIIQRQGREVTVSILDELDVADIRENDIIFIGPLHRLGPLAEYYDRLSHYTYERDQNRLKDNKTGQYLTARKPMSREGLDYGIFAEFRGPEGNHIMIFGSVASDIGLLQIVHSLTSPAEIARIKDQLLTAGQGMPTAFEALFSATGYERTDLVAKVIDIHALKQLPADDINGGP
jgi:hypothetical protein